jgi:hypothetical protein
MCYSGVASFEQIVQATAEGFNMEYTLASALAAFGIVSQSIQKRRERQTHPGAL